MFIIPLVWDIIRVISSRNHGKKFSKINQAEEVVTETASLPKEVSE
jgi:hypothetical protein